MKTNEQAQALGICLYDRCGNIGIDCQYCKYYLMRSDMIVTIACNNEKCKASLQMKLAVDSEPVDVKAMALSQGWARKDKGDGIRYYCPECGK